jgi:hypothetical protein
MGVFTVRTGSRDHGRVAADARTDDKVVGRIRARRIKQADE